METRQKWEKGTKVMENRAKPTHSETQKHKKDITLRILFWYKC